MDEEEKGEVRVEVTVDVELDEKMMKILSNIGRKHKSKKDTSTE